ncbi:MAG: hypothetical protein ABIJ96_01465 [Elusimicrobiota bacterium]
MKYLFAAAALSMAVNVQAAGSFQIPASAQKLRITNTVGQQPAETKIKLIEVFETFRLTQAIVPLGGKNYHVSVQPMRDGNWAAALIPEGRKKFDMVASYPFRALRKTGGYEDEIEGATFKVSLVDMADGDEALVFTTKEGLVAAFSVQWMKYAVWNAAVPVPSIGPDWRFVFRVDLWVGAGMRTFSFLQKTQSGVVFHDVRAESVDFFPRERVKEVGERKVSLGIDDEGYLVIKPVVE